jgi:hypothetical protein
MYEHDSAFSAWSNETLSSDLYVNEKELENIKEKKFLK